jgi:hypothetical protein
VAVALSALLKARLTQTIEHLCKDIEKGHDPKPQALFGPTAELLEEHVTASEHLEQKQLAGVAGVLLGRSQPASG